MKGYIVVEKIDDLVNLHYAVDFETANQFIKEMLPDINCSYYDEVTGTAFGKNEFEQNWSVEVYNFEDIDIL